MKKQGTTSKEAADNRRTNRIAKSALALVCTAAAIAAIWTVPVALVDKQIKNIM